MRRFALAFMVACSVLPVESKGEDGGGGSVGVGGQANPVCSFQAAPRQVNSSNMSLSSATINSGQINVDELIDEATAFLNVASIDIEILGICNQPHHLSLLTTKGGLAPEAQATPVDGSFSHHINYLVEVDWAGRTIVLQTDAVAGRRAESGLIDGPNSGALNISLTIDGSTNEMTTPVISGTYSDSLIIQIGELL